MIKHKAGSVAMERSRVNLTPKKWASIGNQVGCARRGLRKNKTNKTRITPANMAGFAQSGFHSMAFNSALRAALISFSNCSTWALKGGICRSSCARDLSLDFADFFAARFHDGALSDRGLRGVLRFHSAGHLCADEHSQSKVKSTSMPCACARIFFGAA